MTELELPVPPPPAGREGWPWTLETGTKERPDNAEWPKISIVTPSYNQGQFIEETIRSVLLQEYPNLEYLVLDGGSTDETLQVLRKYTGLIEWESGPDEGQTDAINKGWSRASGEIIAYINSDDVYEPGVLFGIVRYFRDHPDVDLVYGDIVHIDPDSAFLSEHKTGILDLDRYLDLHFYFPQPTVFLRRSVLADAGCPDKNLHYVMDFDYWLRILPFRKTGYLPVRIAKARIYSDAKSMSLTPKKYDEIEFVLTRFFGRLPPDNPLKAREGKALSNAALYRGMEYLKMGMRDEAYADMRLSFARNPVQVLNVRAVGALLLSATNERVIRFAVKAIEYAMRKTGRSSYRGGFPVADR